MASKQMVMAPLNGTVLGFSVNVGDKVSMNDKLFILEAMKMENEIYAEASGIVTAVHVSPGDVVDTNQVIMTIETL